MYTKKLDREKEQYVLRMAIAGCEAERAKLDETIESLRARLGGHKAVSTTEDDAKPKHRMSLAGRRAISRATKARWAKAKAEGRILAQPAVVAPPTAPPKRKLSNAQLAAMRKNAVKARKVQKAKRAAAAKKPITKLASKKAPLKANKATA